MRGKREKERISTRATTGSQTTSSLALLYRKGGRRIYADLIKRKREKNCFCALLVVCPSQVASYERKPKTLSPVHIALSLLYAYKYMELFVIDN